MSRIGKKPIDIPDKVKAEVKDSQILLEGPKGKLSRSIPSSISAEIKDGKIFLTDLKRIAGHSVLISTPKEFIHQKVEANPYENHRSLWSKEDLLINGFTKILDNDFSWIAIYLVTGLDHFTS